jgi:hypothetical protein
VYELAAGPCRIHAGDIHGHAHKHEHSHEHAHDEGRAHVHGALISVKLVLLQSIDGGEAGIESLLGIAGQVFEGDALPIAHGAQMPPGRLVQLTIGAGAELHVNIPEAGHWVLFAEHAPQEFGLHMHGLHAAAEREFGSHHHEAEITSIGISDERALNSDKVNDWLSYLLQSRGQDIMRMKGILSFKNEPRRYVFHGVHMIFDGKLERPWGDSPRMNRLVFIGRTLDRKELEAGFESCVA